MSTSSSRPRLGVTALGAATLCALLVTPAHAAEPGAPWNVVSVANVAGGAHAVAVDGAYAYVARGAAGFQVQDRSSPASPSVVATVLPGDGAAVHIRDVAVHAGHLYVANYDDVANGATGKFTGVYVYDVSTPSSPTEVARIDWGSQRLYHLAAMVYDLAVAEVAGTPYLFCVSDITSAVEVFDVSDPSLPVWTTSLPQPAGVGGYCEDVVVHGDRGFVAWLTGGVASFDLSDLASIQVTNDAALDWGDLVFPTQLFHHQGAIGTARGLAVSGDGATMAVTDAYGSTGKLRLFDVATPTACSALGTYDAGTGADPFGVVLDGDYAWVAWGTDGLRVLDVSTPLTPTFVGRYDTTDARRVTLAGAYALLADPTDGVRTLTLRDDVVIVSATWSKKYKTLTVKATSTASQVSPAASLVVTGRGAMGYSSTTNQYTFTQWVNTKPTSVTVVSSWGDTATLPVTQVK